MILAVASERLAAGVAIVISGIASPLAYAQGLPQNAVPVGLYVAEGSAGGRIVYGQLSTAPSGDLAFKKGLRCIADYFHDSLDLQTVKRNQDGTVTVAVFTASLKGQPVKGLALTKVDETQQASIAFLFDSSDRFQQTSAGLCNDFRAIVRQPQEQNEETQPAPASSKSDFSTFAMQAQHLSLASVEAVSLTTTKCPDGTGSVGIASGFNPQSMKLGTFSIKSEKDGAYANICASTVIYDPSAPILRTIGRNPGIYIAPYDPDPVRAWKTLLTRTAQMTQTPDPAPQILKSETMPGLESGQSGARAYGTMTVNHEPFVFVAAIIITTPSKNLTWTLLRSVLAAPQRNAAADMPALIAMYKSAYLDKEALHRAGAQELQREQAGLQAALNRREQAFQGLQGSMRRSADVQAKVVAGWNNVIRQQDVVETTINGVEYHKRVGYDEEHWLVDSGAFKVVPLSQYVKGVDY
jgi:hypothetical protein